LERDWGGISGWRKGTKVQYSVKQKVTDAVEVRTGMSWVRPTCERAMFALERRELMGR